MRAEEINPEYQDLNNDNIMSRDQHDSRKPTITLVSLNKLKKMRAAKDLENLMRGDFLEVIYGSNPDDQGGGL